MSDRLVYGKSDLKGVVGLEVTDDSTEVFVQDSTGSISSVFLPNKFWILSSKNIGGKFARLKGDLHFKYGTQFKDRKTWQKCRGAWKSDDIYTIWNQEEAMMVKDGVTFYQGLTPEVVSLLSFDIESTGLDGTADDAKVLLISTTYRDQHTKVNKLFSYTDYKTEGDMLEDFCNYVREKNPSLLIGHNIVTYDFVYLQARADANNVQLILGRNDSPIEFNDYTSEFRLDGTRSLEYKNVKVYGREIVDTYFLSVSFDIAKNFETYGLKALIKQLGFEKDDRQHYDASLIRTNYKNPEEWKKICDYAIADAEDSLKLWDFMGASKFYWAQKVPKPFTELLLGATGSQINSIMVRAYLQDGHSIPKADEVKKYPGAISIGIPGVYKNCLRWDVASLYPSIIIEYEVYDNTKDPNAYFLQLVTTLTKTRLKNKKIAKETGSKYYSDLEQSEKIGINSAYGFMGASGLNFNCLEAADFITAKGREILMKGINWSTGLKDEEIIRLCPNQHEE